MMRYHTFKILSTVGGGFDVSEEDLVSWANAKVWWCAREQQQKNQKSVVN